MNTIKPFNRSRCQFIRHLRTASTLDARVLSLELGRIVQPAEIIIGAAFQNGLVAWLLRTGEKVWMAQTQLSQYIEDLAEL